MNARKRPADQHSSLAVAVLLGGWSAEREVSRCSGQAVLAALRVAGHDAMSLDPAEIDVLAYPWQSVDAAFLALHGGFGENGSLQQILDELQVAYTGCGPAACRIAMSKRASKTCFTRAGVPTPSTRIVSADYPMEAAVAAAIELQLPVVTKPDSQGSSIGVSIVRDISRLGEALSLCFEYDHYAIVERYIDGRELTVAVLDGQALPLIEIRSPREFYDYCAKYHDDATEYLFDVDLPATCIRSIEQAAITATESLGCRGVVRVDLRLDAELRPWVLEVNTIPGFTDHSLVPKAAARAGIAFPDLCDRLVRLAIDAAPSSQPLERAA